MKEVIKLDDFGKVVASDRMRNTFNFHNEQLIHKGRKIDYLFIGDSITEQWDVHLYFDDLGFIVNRGIGGDVTKYLLKRAEADIFQLNPKNVVFLAGINDIITCSPDLWWKKEGADRNVVIDEAEKNISAIMKRCKEKGIKGYFCSILPIDMCLPYSLFELEPLVVSLNEKIRALCQKFEMTYVDYHSELCAEDGLHLKDGYSLDGLHPNSICYEVMETILKRYL